MINYLPLIIFIAFLMPNTRIDYLNQSMIQGRWAVLFLVTGYTLLIYLYRKLNYSSMSYITGIGKYFLLTYFWMALSIFNASNQMVSFLKWFSFLTFLIFCMSFSKIIRSKNQIIKAINPIIKLFVIIILTTPIAIMIFPQVYAINGVFIFAPALGHFFAVFGTSGVLFLLNYEKTGWKRTLLFVALPLSVLFTVASRSRAGAVITICYLMIAFIRRSGQKALLGKMSLFIMIILAISFFNIWNYVERFVFKYDKAIQMHDIMDSRTPFFQKDLIAIEKRELFGYGFGCQQQTVEQKRLVASSGMREQGSTIYGLLEEVGFLGSIPIFLFLIIVAYRCSVSVLKSDDALELFLSRVILTGLGISLIENYLLYLGNATSILVFFSFFMRESLLSLSYNKSKYKIINQQPIYYTRINADQRQSNLSES